MFNYNKLKGRIIEILGSYSRYAEELGLSRSQISNKLEGRVQFTQKQIADTMRILNIDKTEIGLYFFNIEVVKNITEEE